MTPNVGRSGSGAGGSARGALPIVDAHMHFVYPESLDYGWLEGREELRPPFTPAELDRQRGGAPIEGLLVVQADCAAEQGGAEVELVERLAARDARIAGMVAFAPLELGAAAFPVLEDLAARPLVKGVRRLLQDEADPAFCLAPGFLAGLRRAAGHGLVFDACVRHHQLAELVELARRVPEASIVLDHLGKPDVAGGRLDPWRAELAKLAALPNTFAKLSGLATEADRERWTPADLRPYVEHALERFGPPRLLFGSDWPIATLATTYPRWVEVVVELLEGAGAGEGALRAVLRDNALRVYGLGGPSLGDSVPS